MHHRLAVAAALLAAPAFGQEADVEQGFNLFQQHCRTCHVMTEGDHRLGPSLHGVVGREVGSVEGFDYSDSLANSDEVWDEEHLDAYLENPGGVYSGTTMIYAGMPEAEDRAAVIAYIVSESGGSEGDEEPEGADGGEGSGSEGSGG